MDLKFLSDLVDKIDVSSWPGAFVAVALIAAVAYVIRAFILRR